MNITNYGRIINHDLRSIVLCDMSVGRTSLVSDQFLSRSDIGNHAENRMAIPFINNERTVERDEVPR